MSNLASADWLILIIYCFFALSASLSLRPAMTGGRAFFEAGRVQPAWLCGLAMAFAGLGVQAPVILGMGARFGWASVPFAVLGGVPSLLFLGLVLMPVYYASKARTLPEFLGLRFGGGTRWLAAMLLLVSSAAGAALSLYTMARIFAALHLFDQPMRAAHIAPSWSFAALMVVPAALVLAYVLVGGLAGSIHNHAMQLCVVVAGFLPVVLLGVKQVGWSRVKAAAFSAGAASGNGFGAFALAAVLGLVFSVGFWCADFRVVQTAMTAKDAASARRAPLIAAALWLLLPLLLIVPALVALAMPTPHTAIAVHNENGVIYHEIAVVSPAEEAGRGLVPALSDPATGEPLHAPDGGSRLDSALAAPRALLHFLPVGLLGLGLAALLACAMGGAAASITAFGAVFARDLYRPKNEDDRRTVSAGRWAIVAGILIAFGLACAAFCWQWKLETAALAFTRLNAPLLATILLGAFWRRATGRAALVGLVAGMAVSALPSLPAGIFGALAFFRGPNDLAPGAWATATGFAVTLLVTAAVSLCTVPRAETELTELAHSPAKRRPAKSAWWKRLETLAVVIFLAAIAVSLIFV